LIGIFGLAKSSWAATYYMPDNCANFSACFSQMNGGDTLVIRNGTYNQALVGMPNGNAGSYTIIKAENDGGAIITGGLAIAHTNQYIQVEGLKFQSQLGNMILGNHIKIMRCAFNGGPEEGNNVTAGCGTNDYNDTAYILFEDCWFYGQGGRYSLIAYNSNYVVFRRNVIRHDGYWTDDKGDPEAGIAIYNSANVELQNNIIIDSNLPYCTDNNAGNCYHAWGQGFYIIYNSASPNITNNVKVRGNIVLNVDSSAYRFDGSPTTIGISTWTDNVAYDYSQNNAESGAIINGGSSVTLDLAATKSTLGKGNYGLGAWGGGTPSLDHSILFDNAGGDTAGGFSMSNLDRYNNGSSDTCSNCVSYNPKTNGLLYLPRIESGSNLNTGGIGASITKKIGVSGTLYGDTGYNTTTGDNLWPWPNESRIKTDMAAVSARGFAAGTSRDGSPQTLTKYIWEYLGNQIPSDIYGSSGDTTPPSAPQGLSVQ
jgi:hypothetical protein